MTQKKGPRGNVDHRRTGTDTVLQSNTRVKDLPDINELIRGHGVRQELARKSRVKRALTDLGNAERFVDRFGEVVKYDHARKVFLYWDGRAWTMDGTGVCQYLATLTVRGIYSEAALYGDSPAERADLAQWARKSESANRQKATLELARSMPSIAVTTAAFDRDRDILNVENGIADLRTARLLPHDPARMCSKLATVEYHEALLDRDADGIPAYATVGGVFARFIAEVTLGRRDLAEYLRVLAGYSITGHTVEHLLHVFYGIGGNGKSVYTDAQSAILGPYAASPNAELLIETRTTGANPELADLCGVRLANVQETDDGARLAEARLKTLTGGDRLKARWLFGNPFEFAPSHKIQLSTNHKPVVRTGGHAIWRRLRLVPWAYQVPDDHIDRELPKKLCAEHPNMLAWMIEGARDWYAHGLPESATVNSASSAYRDEQDRIGPFMAACTVDLNAVHRSTLYKAYRTWAEREAEEPLSNTGFYAALAELGYEQRRRVFHGLSLKEST